MAMPHEIQTATAKISLLGDSAAINSRLQELASRIGKAADLLHGSAPHEAASGGSVPQPAANLRRNIDVAADILCNCENEMSRLEGRL